MNYFSQFKEQGRWGLYPEGEAYKWDLTEFHENSGHEWRGYLPQYT